jgi:hypothetical protein
VLVAARLRHGLPTREREYDMTHPTNAIVLITGLLACASSALAHPHVVIKGNGDERVLASGQNHPSFINGVSCVGIGSATGVGPAWYGLETAHHGPDAGAKGKRDGCYQTTGSVPPGQDVQSPVIR